VTAVRGSSGLLAAIVAGLLAAGCAGSASPPASAGPALEIVAEGIAFSPAALRLPAATAIHVVLHNRDEGVPHGVLVTTRTSGVEPTRLGESGIVTGPAEFEFSITPLPAGPYLFSCPVHPDMQIEVDVGTSGV
jgi:plastocyanin